MAAELTLEEKIANARKAASDKIAKTGTEAQKVYASKINQTRENVLNKQYKTMGDIDPGLTQNVKTSAQNLVDNNVSNMGTGSTNQFNSNALFGSGGASQIKSPGTTTGFENLGFSPEEISAYQQIQQKYLDLSTQPIQVAGLEDLQNKQKSYLDTYESLGRQIQEQEGRIKGVGEALGAEGGELTNIARQRIETKQTAPLREQLSNLLSTRQDFGSVIGNVNNMMNTAIDNARAEKQQQLTYLNQFIENSPMTSAQKSLLQIQAKAKADELYNQDIQYANAVKSALLNGDISMFDDQMQYQIIQGQVDSILNSPAFKGIATQRSPQQIVSDIQKAIKSGSNLEYELTQLQSQMKSKPEYAAKEAAAKKKISGKTGGGESFTEIKIEDGKKNTYKNGKLIKSEPYNNDNNNNKNNEICELFGLEGEECESFGKEEEEEEEEESFWDKLFGK